MKFRFIYTMAVMLLIAQSAISQGIVLGVTARASLNNFDLKGNPQLSTDLSNVNGVEAGLYLSFSAAGWYVKPMALASFLKGTVNSSVDGAKEVETDFELSTLEIPLIVGIKLFPVLSIEGGPSWNYLINYTESVNGVNIDLSRQSIGYRAGLRANFSRIGIFGHYGGIIEELGESEYQLSRPARIVFGVTFDLVSAK